MEADLPDMDDPPHPRMPHVLRLNDKAAELQARANATRGEDGVGLAFRAELVRESRRIALAEVTGGGGG